MKYRIYRTGLTGLSRQPLEISNSRVLVFFCSHRCKFLKVGPTAHSLACVGVGPALRATLHHTDLGP